MKKSPKTNHKIVRFTKNQLKNMEHRSKTDFKKIDALSDQEIDYSDIPERGAAFWAKAKVVDHVKRPISLRVDVDVLDWFKHQDGRYQKLMNHVLRQYMNAHQRQR